MDKSKKIISTLGSYSGYKSMPMWSGNLCKPGKGTFVIDIESVDIRGNNIGINDNGALKVTGVDDNEGFRIYYNGNFDLVRNLVAGKEYCVKIIGKSSTGLVRLYHRDLVGDDQILEILGVDWTEFSYIFTAGNDLAGIWLRCTDLRVDETSWIDLYEIRERRG